MAVLAGVALTVAACGDDANDAALQSELDAERIAAIRSTSTLPAPTTTTPLPSTSAPADGQVSSTTSTEPVAVTVEPTGVVVPVIALDNIFRPDRVVVAVGDEVLWENRGQNDHNVLYIDGDDWGVEVEGFGPGATYAHVFTVPGEYDYYCSIHGTSTFGMIGTVVVEA